MPWREMAVLVRAGARSIPALRRGAHRRRRAGRGRRRRPPAAPRTGGGAAADGAAGGGHRGAARPRAPSARSTPTPRSGLLASPLAGAGRRRSARAGSAAPCARRSGPPPTRSGPAPSPELLARGAADPDGWPSTTRRTRRRRGSARCCARRASRARRRAAPPRRRCGSCGTAPPGRSGWRARRARRGGRRGNADRDLDAVCALFETAARAEEQRGPAASLNFLGRAATPSRSPPTPSPSAGVRRDAVRLLTAHRSKGLEWRLVVVARRPGGRLAGPAPARLAAGGRPDRPPAGAAAGRPPGRCWPRSAGCSTSPCTRARERLVVTAVESAADDGDQPSRFLDRAGRRTRVPAPAAARRGRCRCAGLVAELRADRRRPGDVRRRCGDAAARRLGAARARATEHGQPLVPAADPDRWWGLHAPEPSERAGAHRRRAGRAVGSAAGRRSLACPAQWFLEREVTAERGAVQRRPGLRQRGPRPRRRGRHRRAPADRRACSWSTSTRCGTQLALPHALDRGPGAEPRRGGARPVPAAGTPSPAPHRGRHRAAASRSRSTRRPAGPALRVRRPGRVRRRGPGRGRRPQDRQVPATAARTSPSNPQLGVYQLAVARAPSTTCCPRAAGPAAPGGAELVQLRQGEAAARSRCRPRSRWRSTTTATDGGAAARWRRSTAVPGREPFPAQRRQATAEHCSFPRSGPVKGAGTVLLVDGDRVASRGASTRRTQLRRR